jgi:hypothetical protein
VEAPTQTLGKRMAEMGVGQLLGEEKYEMVGDNKHGPGTGTGPDQVRGGRDASHQGGHGGSGRVGG